MKKNKKTKKQKSILEFNKDVILKPSIIKGGIEDDGLMVQVQDPT